MSDWIPADKELPGNPRCVLATDGEYYFIAFYVDIDADRERLDELVAGWNNAQTDDPIDSVVTHWMELPEVPAE